MPRKRRGGRRTGSEDRMEIRIEISDKRGNPTERETVLHGAGQEAPVCGAERVAEREIRARGREALYAACRRAGRARAGNWRIFLDAAAECGQCAHGPEAGVSPATLLQEAGMSREAALLQEAVRCLYDGAYRFRKDCLKELVGRPVFANRDALADYGTGIYTFVLSGLSEENAFAAAERGKLLGICKGYARSLGNLPNNYLHAQQMTDYAADLARMLGDGVSCRVLDHEALERMGCGALLAVNRGRKEEAFLITLEYAGGEKTDRKLALVGKGLLFDSGGYHLKSISGMNGMKYDMCGAAGVLEAFEFLVRSRTPVNLMAVLALGENLIGPEAVKMGDVITTLSGKTVEVYNTDAEGRLALCDALTWAQRCGAAQIVDLATLTYSAQAALGDETGALFGNRDELCRDMQKAAETADEAIWRLPTGERYHRLLEWSICADFANYAPDKGAGASVAACFLENFIEPGTGWLHLDIVGPSVIRSATEEMSEGASGFGVASVAAYVQAWARSKGTV